MNFMNEKDLFLDNLTNCITGNSLNLLEKNQLLLKTMLLLFSNNEQDKDIWTKIFQLSYLTTNDDKEQENYHQEKKKRMWEMNCENIIENEKKEKKYNNLTEINKKIFSYRVLCPKSSDYNFNPFF